MSKGSEGDPGGVWVGRAQGLLALEAIAVLIALAMPITPSKTGSTWSPASLFWPDPNYLQKVAVSFVGVNLLLVLIGVAAWIAFKLGAGDD
jgi:hypothetical protein